MTWPVWNSRKDQNGNGNERKEKIKMKGREYQYERGRSKQNLIEHCAVWLAYQITVSV